MLVLVWLGYSFLELMVNVIQSISCSVILGLSYNNITYPGYTWFYILSATLHSIGCTIDYIYLAKTVKQNGLQVLASLYTRYYNYIRLFMLGLTIIYKVNLYLHDYPSINLLTDLGDICAIFTIAKT